MMRKCYSVSRSPIDENNDSLSKSRIVFRHEVVAKFTSAAEFSVAEYLSIYFTYQIRFVGDDSGQGKRREGRLRLILCLVSSIEQYLAAGILVLPIIYLNLNDMSCMYSTLCLIEQQSRRLNMPTACVTFNRPCIFQQNSIAHNYILKQNSITRIYFSRTASPVYTPAKQRWSYR